MRRFHPVCGLAACLLAAAFAFEGHAQSATLAQANAALQAGQADKALSLLASLPQGGQNNAQAQNIACRVRFPLAQWNEAAQNCEQAVKLDEHNSDYHMWLGRALGEQANRASFLKAYSLGKRVLSEFKTAADLDPSNAEALRDLGEFYVEAPGVAGGGLDKAESVAQQLDHISPERALELRSRIAQKRNDWNGAENDLKKAITVGKHPAHQWVSLARFYQQRSRWSDMETAIHNAAGAAARDPHAAVALYDGAGVLIRAGRDPELAAKMLKDYLAGSYKTDEAPAFVAYYRLAQLQQQLGDAAGAQASQATAYSLAQEYKPARDGRR